MPTSLAWCLELRRRKRHEEEAIFGSALPERARSGELQVWDLRRCRARLGVRHLQQPSLQADGLHHGEAEHAADVQDPEEQERAEDQRSDQGPRDPRCWRRRDDEVHRERRTSESNGETMTADELEQIKHRAASCYVGTAWRGAIADVRKLIDAVDAMNLQNSELRIHLRAMCDEIG